MGLCNPEFPQWDVAAWPADWTDPSEGAEEVYAGGAGGSATVDTV